MGPGPYGPGPGPGPGMARPWPIRALVASPGTVIRIIRREDDPKLLLMKRYRLKEDQAEAILELRLRQLAKLEEKNIRGEQKELTEEKADLQKILNSAARLKRLVRDELLADAEEFGDQRRSPLIEREVAKPDRKSTR
mgnify:CR=1 FL=1